MFFDNWKKCFWGLTGLERALKDCCVETHYAKDFRSREFYRDRSTKIGIRLNAR